MHEWQLLDPDLCFLSRVLFEVDSNANVIEEGSPCLGFLRFVLNGSCQMTCVNLITQCIIK